MKQTKSSCSVSRVVSLVLALLLVAGLLGPKAVSVSAEQTSPIKGTSVTLGSALVVNFLVEVTDTQGAEMTFLVNGATQTVSVAQAQQVQGNLYSFPCTLAAAQMTDTVQATFTDSGNTYQKSTSVRAYADQLLSSKQWDLLAANDIMVATLNYGAAAQNYFGYNTQDPADTGYEMAEAPQVPESQSDSVVSGGVSGIQLYGATLVCRSEVAVRFYFTTTGDINAYSFSTGNAPVAKDDMYYIEVSGIDPQDYDQDITLTVSDGTDEMTVTYSPMTYLSRMYAKTENAALKTLVGSMYQYHSIAVSYLADPYGNSKDNLVAAQ